MAKRYRALVDMSLRQSPDPGSPLYQEWHNWKAGEVFDAPKHLRLDRCFERGLIEEVKAKKPGDSDGE